MAMAEAVAVVEAEAKGGALSNSLQPADYSWWASILELSQAYERLLSMVWGPDPATDTKASGQVRTRF